jgi:hypothetical protein
MNCKPEPLPRCCPVHTDWGTLALHLRVDFPSVAASEVLRSLHEARMATSRFDLDEEEAIEVGELMVRYRLMLTIGARVDGARIDPQTHTMSGSRLEPAEDGEDSAVVVG